MRVDATTFSPPAIRISVQTRFSILYFVLILSIPSIRLYLSAAGGLQTIERSDNSIGSARTTWRGARQVGTASSTCQVSSSQEYDNDLEDTGTRARTNRSARPSLTISAFDLTSPLRFDQAKADSVDRIDKSTTGKTFGTLRCRPRPCRTPRNIAMQAMAIPHRASYRKADGQG